MLREKLGSKTLLPLLVFLTANTHSTMYYRSLRQSSFLRFSFSPPSASAFRPSVCSFLPLSVPFRPNRRQNQSPPASEMEHGRNQGRASERAESRREQKLDASFSLLSSFPLASPSRLRPFSYVSANFPLSTREDAADRTRVSVCTKLEGRRQKQRGHKILEKFQCHGPRDGSASVGEGAHRGCVVTVVAMAQLRIPPALQRMGAT